VSVRIDSLTTGGFAVSRDHSRLLYGVVLCLALGKVVLISGCGGSDTASAVNVSSAQAYTDSVRQLEENNKKHLQAAAAARKAARAKR
jgi:hypothetical protein